MVEAAMGWLSEHRAILIWATAGSVVLLLATLAAGAWMLVRIEPDYLRRSTRGPRFEWASAPVRIALIIGKNALGWALILLGVAMLALPGQGLITIAVGLVLVDLPGKRRVIRSILGRESVLTRINTLRRRAGREPLQPPHPTGSAAGSSADDRSSPTMPHGQAPTR